MNNEMPTIEHLDSVLKYYAEHDYPYPNLPNERAASIINEKLVRDKYLSVKITDRASFHKESYCITIDGLLFNKTNGYSGHLKRETLKTQNQIRKDWLLIVGSWMAAIGAIGICLIEILKKWKWVVTIEALTFWILLGIGICVGIAISLLIQEVWTKGKDK